MQSQILKNSKNETIGIRIIPAKGRKDKKPFTIPVVDVRRSEDARQRAYKMSKGTQSKFIKQSFSGIGLSYNVSMK